LSPTACADGLCLSIVQALNMLQYNVQHLHSRVAFSSLSLRVSSILHNLRLSAPMHRTEDSLPHQRSVLLERHCHCLIKATRSYLQSLFHDVQRISVCQNRSGTTASFFIQTWFSAGRCCGSIMSKPSMRCSIQRYPDIYQ
jgi:hypothetical protein